MMAQGKRPGVDPLYVWFRNTEFRGVDIERRYVRAGGPNAPLPPGVDRLPAPGESLVSPALAELLSESDSHLLQPRLSERVVGELGVAAMVYPTDLIAVIGAPPSYQNGGEVYGFGAWSGGEPELTPDLYVILVLGLVILLTPVFIFIASSSRIAGAERDRRLAALRLVGADIKQVRRIAAAESLVSAAAGLVLGGLLFLAVRSMAADIVIGNESFFPEDLVPSPPLVLLIVLAVPAVALMATQFSLRRTMIEPLGVVRETTPVRRRVAWRILVLVVGAALFLSLDPAEPNPFLLVPGAVLILASGPALLPWLMELLMSRMRGSGTPALQLATRRLQLDAGTPARVVSGVAVVLAGAIALQIVLAGQSARYTWPQDTPIEVYNVLEADSVVGDAAVSAVRSVPGVEIHGVARTFPISKHGDAVSMHGEYRWATLMDCATALKVLFIQHCQTGDAFMRPMAAVRPGETVTVVGAGPLQIPANIREVQAHPANYSLAQDIMLTSAANLDVPMKVTATFRTSDADAIEHVRNAVDFLPSVVQVDDYSGGGYTGALKTFADMRKGLLIGSVIILALAALSLLVMAVEQTRERRRSIAALSATGVPVSTLVRSLLWQTTIPMLIAIVAAVATGVTLAALAGWLMRNPFTMDWPTIGVLTGVTVALTVLVTALTLPTLRSATRLNALRNE